MYVGASENGVRYSAGCDFAGSRDGRDTFENAEEWKV